LYTCLAAEDFLRFIEAFNVCSPAMKSVLSNSQLAFFQCTTLSPNHEVRYSTVQSLVRR